MPTHSRESNTAWQFGQKVYCSRCKRNLYVSRSSDKQLFLLNHQRQCTTTSPRKDNVLSGPIPMGQFPSHALEFATLPEEFPEEGFDVGAYDGLELNRGTAEDLELLGKEEATKTTDHILLGSEIVYSNRQIAKYGHLLTGFDINVLEPSDVVLEIQSNFLEVFSVAADDDGPLMKFRNLSKSVVDWKDLIELYEFGISVGLSDREGNILLALFNEILARHDSNIQLRKSWRDIRLAIDKQKSRKCYNVFTLTEPLPPRFFGHRHYLSKRPLRKFTGTSEDIREVIAEMLLNVDPSKVILEYTPPTDGDGRPLPEADHLLGEFTTGKLFQQFSLDASRFGKIDGNPVVPLCFGVWADETTTSSSRNMSELPVYIALLNAVGDAYQMHFLAYAPFRLPHSEDCLNKQLLSRGLNFKKWRASVIRRTKLKVFRDFLTQILKPLFAFGSNCFKVQIGRGEEKKIVNAFCHLVQIGGDGKMLDDVCGCFHSRGRFCRICLERRRSLFRIPKTRASVRSDAEHEALTFESAELDGRIVDAYIEKGRVGAVAGVKSYQKNGADKAILRKAADLCVTGGDNAMYELFYYANCRGIGRGLHGSCWPDMLHVVLKGIVEKTLAWSLAIVYGIHRLAGKRWITGMALLDDRVANFPSVVNLPCIRWTHNSKGLSALLKTETKSMANADNTTGLMSGGMESWKLASALFQMMICIGSDGLVLPNQTDKHIFKGLGFHEEGMQDISDIVLSAAAACLEMYFAITSKQLRKGDLPTVQYLVECSVFHHVRLSRLFKSLRLRPNGSKSSSRERTLIEWCDAIGGNKCHLLLQHVVESKEWFGANPRQIDTELSEREHKFSVKMSYSRSSKRYETRQREMASLLVTTRAVGNLVGSFRPVQTVGKKRRLSASKQHLTAAQSTKGLRSYKFSAEATPFAQFVFEDDVWMLPAKDHHAFFHPALSLDMISTAVTEFCTKLPGDVTDHEVYAIQYVTIQDEGRPEWKVFCNPAKKLVVGCDDDEETHQVFSGLYGNIGKKETLLRVLGIVLVMVKESTGDGEFTWLSFYAAFLQPFEEGDGSADSAASYLPFPVVYPQFETETRSRDPDRFIYFFSDLDGALRPAAILRFPESITEAETSFGVAELADMFASQRNVPAYHAIDFRRYCWPKSNAWTPVSYQSVTFRHKNEVDRVYQVFPLPSTLSDLQVEFDLETESAVASEDLKHDAPLDADDDDDVGDRVEREVMVGFLGDL